MADIAGSAAAGLVGVSASVDVVSLKNATIAFIGSGANVSAGRDVKVLADQHRDITSVVVGFGGGFVGIQGSVAVINIGSGFSAGGKDALPGGNAGEDDSALTNMGGAANEQANGSDRNQGWRARRSRLHGDRRHEPCQQRDQRDRRQRRLCHRCPGRTGHVGLDRRERDGRSRHHRRGDRHERLNVTGGSVAAGFVGVGVAVAVANVDTNTEAFIAGNGTLSAGGIVRVKASYTLNGDDDDCSLLSLDECIGRAFAGGGGLVAVFGSVIYIEDTSDQTAYVAGSTHIVQADDVTVRAESDRHINILTGEIAGGLWRPAQRSRSRRPAVRPRRTSVDRRRSGSRPGRSAVSRSSPMPTRSSTLTRSRSRRLCRCLGERSVGYHRRDGRSIDQGGRAGRDDRRDHRRGDLGRGR